MSRVVELIERWQTREESELMGHEPERSVTIRMRASTYGLLSQMAGELGVSSPTRFAAELLFAALEESAALLGHDGPSEGDDEYE